MTSQKYDEVSPCRSDADRLRRMHRPLYSFASSPLVHGYAYTKFRTFGETTVYIQQRCVQGRLKLISVMSVNLFCCNSARTGRAAPP